MNGARLAKTTAANNRTSFPTNPTHRPFKGSRTRGSKTTRPIISQYQLNDSLTPKFQQYDWFLHRNRLHAWNVQYLNDARSCKWGEPKTATCWSPSTTQHKGWANVSICDGDGILAGQINHQFEKPKNTSSAVARAYLWEP